MKNFYTISILFLSISFTSCNSNPCGSKSSFIKNHVQFVENIVEQSSDLSEEDWTTKDAEFKKLVEECYSEHKAEFTESEKRDFWERNAKYYVQRVSKKVDIAEISTEIKDFLNNDLKVSIKELESEIKEVFDDELKDDLKETMEVLRESIKEIGDELKQIFKEESK